MASNLRFKTKIAIIGAGQAGLSAAYHLKRLGYQTGHDFVVLDQYSKPGGAWQFRWDSLTLQTVNRVHDLPGMSFEDTLVPGQLSVQANTAVPAYFAKYEQHLDLKVIRPMPIHSVQSVKNMFHLEGPQRSFSALGIINATGTWENPYIPDYPGATRFRGLQLHTKEYHTAAQFKGKHVIVVGGGISAIQLLDEISQVTTTTWVTRREPVFREEPFDDMAGQAAVALVDARVRQGLLPLSVVSVTGLPLSAAVRDMDQRGVLRRQPMFSNIIEEGVQWDDGRVQAADVILWNTGFRGALNHLQPILTREAGGGIRMDGRLATRVASDPRIHLVGYGPSASTIGANRAGGAAVRELITTLNIKPHSSNGKG